MTRPLNREQFERSRRTVPSRRHTQAGCVWQDRFEGFKTNIRGGARRPMSKYGSPQASAYRADPAMYASRAGPRRRKERHPDNAGNARQVREHKEPRTNRCE